MSSVGMGIIPIQRDFVLHKKEIGNTTAQHRITRNTAHLVMCCCTAHLFIVVVQHHVVFDIFRLEISVFSLKFI